MLLPSAAAAAVEVLRDPAVAKAHWPLFEVDERGRRTGEVIPRQPLQEGDFRGATIAAGPDSYLSPPTTGNAWSRHFLEQALPVPETAYRQHADSYLVTLAPLYGAVRVVPEPQGYYRIHGRNDYACRPACEKNRRNLDVYDRRCEALARHFARQGVTADPAAWKSRNPYYAWMHRLAAAADDLSVLLPLGCSVVLVDEDQWSDRWGGSSFIDGRDCVPFLEREGRYWGPPPDDESAIREFERLRDAGASFAVIGWPAFWWLNHYVGWHRHLSTNYRRVLDNDRLVVFDLRG
jgi:hypothetical protein